MRTKTLLLTAALSAVSVATSMAQVFSVNAVGYVNTELKPGFNLISNPLMAADNKISTLFAGVPEGTQVYKFGSTGFTIAAYDSIDGFTPASAGALTVVPGEGVFVRLPGTANFNVTFVGEVPQGALNNAIPAGLSIRSSMVPQAGTAQELGFPGKEGDQIYQWTGTTYKISAFDSIDGWVPPLSPLKVGEAIFVRKAAPDSWNRTFNINQ